MKFVPKCEAWEEPEIQNRCRCWRSSRRRGRSCWTSSRPPVWGQFNQSILMTIKTKKFTITKAQKNYLAVVNFGTILQSLH